MKCLEHLRLQVRRRSSGVVELNGGKAILSFQTQRFCSFYFPTGIQNKELFEFLKIQCLCLPNWEQDRLATTASCTSSEPHLRRSKDVCSCKYWLIQSPTFWTKCSKLIKDLQSTNIAVFKTPCFLTCFKPFVCMGVGGVGIRGTDSPPGLGPQTDCSQSTMM